MKYKKKNPVATTIAYGIWIGLGTHITTMIDSSREVPFELALHRSIGRAPSDALALARASFQVLREHGADHRCAVHSDDLRSLVAFGSFFFLSVQKIQATADARARRRIPHSGHLFCPGTMICLHWTHLPFFSRMCRRQMSAKGIPGYSRSSAYIGNTITVPLFPVQPGASSTLIWKPQSRQFTSLGIHPGEFVKGYSGSP